MVARAIYCLVLLIASAANAVAVTPYVPRDQDERFTLLLNGDWKFKFGITEIDFFMPAYNDAGWRTIGVPGNWELLGFEEPRYGNPGMEVGLYRRTFTPPQEWSGRRILLRFEGVAWGFEFWLNGQRGGVHEIPHCRSEFDITDIVQPGAENVLAVRVYRRYKGWEFDSHDSWALSGIFRDVLLFSVPDPYIADLTATTEVTRDLSHARVRVNARVHRAAPRGPVRGELTGTLLDPAGSVVASTAQPITLARNDDASVDLEVDVVSPQLWSAEKPDLYEWRVDLRLAGAPTHTVRQTSGIRQITVENGVLKLNHQPIKIRGVNHLDIHPTAGQALREEHYRQDIDLMKAGNINAVRLSYYPPHPVFLDLCDRHGLYAIDEVPFDGGDELLRNASYSDILLARADATVQRDKNHASVIGWSLGNENPITPIVLAAAERVKALDPTRPRLMPGAGGPGASYKTDVPAGIEILAPHDPALIAGSGGSGWTLQEAAADPNVRRPILVTKFNAALGSAFEGLRERWETVMANERLAGGFVWHFQDQGLRRKIAGRSIRLGAEDRVNADASTRDICVDVLCSLEEAFDSRCWAGTDGIVYADRIPQVEYWITRRVYSPIVIPETNLAARPGRQAFSIPVWNRYDFTNLDRLRGEWRLVQEGRALRQGSVTLALPPHQTGAIRLEVDAPVDLGRRDHVLEIAFTDAAGRAVYERSLRLLPESQRVDMAGRLAVAPSVKVESRRGPEGEQIAVGDLNITVHPQTNVSLRQGANGPRLSGPVLRVGRDPEMAELLQYKSQNRRFWDEPILERTLVQRQEIEKTADGGRRVRLALEYPRTAGVIQGQRVLADVVLEVSPRAWIDVAYELKPTGAQDFFLELGLGFLLPHTTTQLTWLGDGPYNAYPGQEEANERGVYHVALLPDMEVASRFFAGNRMRVDLAAVTDVAGNGFGFVLEGATIQLARSPQGMVFSQQVRVAGKGSATKGLLTRYPLPASGIQSEKGFFRIVPLIAGQWPKLFQEVLGEAFTKPVSVTFGLSAK